MGLDRRTKSATPKPVLYPRFIVGAGEIVSGSDGKQIEVGSVVRRPIKMSATLGVEVPSRVGRVKTRYRSEYSGRVILETTNGRAFFADECVQSRARLEKEDE